MLRIRHDGVIMMTSVLKINLNYNRMAQKTQPAFTCLNSAIKTAKQCVKYVQS